MGTNFSGQSLLIAMPHLKDPNFKKTVVLLTEHDNTGAIGFILNKPSESSVKDLIIADNHDIPEEIPAWVGGPLGEDNGLILKKSKGLETNESLELTSSDGALSELIRIYDKTSPKKLLYPSRFIIGYSSWEEGQLETELKNGIWLQISVDENIVLNCPWQEMWSRCLDKLGITATNLVTNNQQYIN